MTSCIPNFVGCVILKLRNNFAILCFMLILTWRGIMFVDILHRAKASCKIQTNINNKRHQLICNPSSMTGATNESGTATFPEHPSVNPVCQWASHYSIIVCLCVVFKRSLFVFLSLFYQSLYCLPDSDLRLFTVWPNTAKTV